jgi:hypothetical protein
MSTPENFVGPAGRRRVRFDPMAPRFDEHVEEPPEPYTGEPTPDYFASQDELSARQRVDADPSAAARHRDLPPPYAGALEMSQEGGDMWTLPDGAGETAAGAKAGIAPRAASSTSPAAGAPPSQLDRDRAEYDQLAANPHPQHHGSRWGAVLQNALYNLGRNAQAVSDGAARSGRPVDMYGIANVIGGGIGGAAAGAMHPGVIEERQREQKMREMERNINFQLKAQQSEADYNAKLATAEYTRQRVPLERLKREGTQLDRDRRTLLSMWRTVGEYDPQNPRYKSMTDEAARLNVTLQPYKRGEKPPQRFNHLGREWEYLKDEETGEYYARPVEDAQGQSLAVDASKVPDARGLLPGQAAVDDDRDRGFKATQEYRSQLLGFSSARLKESMLNGLSARSGREFATATRGLFERRSKIETQISDLQKRAASLTVDPADARQRVADLERERGDLTAQIDAERSKALGAMSSPIAPRSTSPARAARPAAPSAPAPAGRVSRRNFDRVRAQNPSLRGKSDAEVEAALRAQGIVVY